MSEPAEAQGNYLYVTFVTNMKAARVALGMTQADLAEALAQQGLTFHQSTVQRLESKSRDVKLDEAVAIAKVLGLSVEEMTKPSAQAEQVARLVSELRQFREAAKGLSGAATTYDLYRKVALRRYDRIRKDSPDFLAAVEAEFQTELSLLSVNAIDHLLQLDKEQAAEWKPLGPQHGDRDADS